MTPSTEGNRLLEVLDLKVEFASSSGTVRSVDGVTFHINRGETLTLVGESGSGKSVTALSLVGLLPRAISRLAGGSIHFNGRDIGTCSVADMRRLRGTEIGMVFQEPMTSLNPVMTVGAQLAERWRIHHGLSRRAAATEAVEMLARVKIPEPARRAESYPHQMSGGMRQRVMIAMALACKPKLLIADEPTTALDVTIQAQILDLMRKLQDEFRMAILFITHDLGVVAQMADRVAVMYAGRVVEQAAVRDLFAHPRMPYTQALLRSIPQVDRTVARQARLEAISGSVPDARDLPTGCTFHPRCRFREPICTHEKPPLDEAGPEHAVRCHRWRTVTLERSVSA